MCVCPRRAQLRPRVRACAGGYAFATVGARMLRGVDDWVNHAYGGAALGLIVGGSPAAYVLTARARACSMRVRAHDPPPPVRSQYPCGASNVAAEHGRALCGGVGRDAPPGVEVGVPIDCASTDTRLDQLN